MVSSSFLRDKAAIVGIGQTEFSRNSGCGELRLAVEAITAALDDCGLTPADVDGLVKLSLESVDDTDVINALGMRNVRSMAHWTMGGNTPSALVKLAAMMVATGQANVVVGWRALNVRSGRRFGQSDLVGRVPGDAGYQAAVGYLTMPQWAAVALSTRRNANRNPRATFYERELTLDDYMNARMIAEPICLFDCCLESDGACAWVVTSAERARDLKQTPRLHHGRCSGRRLTPRCEGGHPWEPPRIHHRVREYCVRQRTVRDGGDRAQGRRRGAGLRPLHPMGRDGAGGLRLLRERGGGPFVASGAIEYGKGHLPMNTSGGHLSEAYIHGHNHILEGVRQIRGTSTSQVDNVEISMVTSSNGSTTSALLLRK